MDRYPPNFSSQHPQPNFPNSQDKSSNKVYWILGIFLVLLVFAGGYILYSVTNSDEDSDIEDIEQQTQTIPETSQNLISCKDIDCFIEQTIDCNPANLTYDLGINLFGWIQNHTYYYEIKGKEGDGCRYYTRIENVYGEYDEETRQAFLDDNMTESEIDQQEKEVNDVLKTTIGADGSCLVSEIGLTKMFTDLKSGSLSFDTVSS
ncbi:MAG: hypothetical protein WD876_00940, partial [Candidatus Pacearchaeota archaeon]